MTLEMIRQEEKEAGIQEGIEQGLKAGIQQGLNLGSQQKAVETAKNLKNANIDIKTIAQCTGLSIEEIEKL